MCDGFDDGVKQTIKKINPSCLTIFFFLALEPLTNHIVQFSAWRWMMELKCNNDNISVEYSNEVKILTSNVIACASGFRGFFFFLNAVRKHFSDIDGIKSNKSIFSSSVEQHLNPLRLHTECN